MTLAEIRASEAAFLKPTDVAEVLRCSPHLIRVAARDDPKLLGFPVVRIGNRTKIPRRAFLDFMGEGPPGESPYQSASPTASTGGSQETGVRIATAPPGLRNDENTPFREEGGEDG